MIKKIIYLPILIFCFWFKPISEIFIYHDYQKQEITYITKQEAKKVYAKTNPLLIAVAGAAMIGFIAGELNVLLRNLTLNSKTIESYTKTVSIDSLDDLEINTQGQIVNGKKHIAGSKEKLLGSD